MPEPFEHHGPPPEAPRPHGPVGIVLDQFRRGGVFHRLGEKIKAHVGQLRNDPQKEWFPTVLPEVKEFNNEVKDRIEPDLKIISEDSEGAAQLRREYHEIPKAIQEVLQGIVSEKEMFGAREVPIITTLIEASIGRSDSDPGHMEYILGQVYEVRDTHPELSQKILRRLLTKIRARNLQEYMSQNLLAEVSEFVTPPNNNESITTAVEEAKLKEYMDKKSKMDEATKGFTRRIRSFERRIRSIDQDSGDLFTRYFPRVNASFEIREREIVQFETFVRGLVSGGVLTPEEEKEVTKLMFDYFDHVEAVEVEMMRILKDKGLKEMAEWLQIKFSDEQMKILDKLSNIDKLADHLMQLKTDAEASGEPDEWWKTFTFQVRDVLEDLFSTSLDAYAQDFFDQGFDQLNEGRFYKGFLQALRNLGSEIDAYKGTNPNAYLLKDMKVKIPGVTFLGSRKQTFDQGEKTVGGKQAHAHLTTTDVALPEAISSWLMSRMTSFKDIVEYFHNAEVISDKGMGFEQMAKFAERLEMSELDDILLEDPDLALAYSLYIKSLHDFLALHNRHVINAFGERDHILDLDQIQADAFIKFCVLTGKKPESLTSAEKRKLKRKIRMASGIAKGGTAEFWDALLTSRMLVSWEIETDEHNHKHFKVKRPFYGGQNGGYEKMIAGLDLDLLEERFDVPGHWPFMRYAFQPRDLDFQEDTWKDSYDHSQVGEYMELAENARSAGYTDKLLDFDLTKVIFGDCQKTTVLDLMRRGGWRFAQYEADLIWIDREGKKVVDYTESLKNMKKFGLYAVKTFLDDRTMRFGPDRAVREQIRTASQFQNVDISDFTRKYPKVRNFQEFMAELEKQLAEKDRLEKTVAAKHQGLMFWNKNKMKVIKDYEAKFMQILYEVEIMQRVIDIYPTMAVSMERRRHTPENENTLFEELNDYLYKNLATSGGEGYARQYIEGRMYPFFISATEIVEQKMWINAKASGNLDYRIEHSDFLRPDIRESLQSFFEFYKRHSPTITERSTNQKLSLENMDYDQFEVLLLGFFKHMGGRRDNGVDQAELKRLKDHDQMSPSNFGIDKKRFDRNEVGEGGEQELRQRLAFMLQQGIGEIHHDLGGGDFDFTNFLMQQGGARATARMMSETHKVVEGLNETLIHLINEGFHKFALADTSSKHALEEAAEKHLAEDIEKMILPIRMMAQDQADAYSVRLIIFIERLFAKDRAFRIKFLGDFFENIYRTSTGGQATLMADNYIQTFERKVTQLDSDDWKVVKDVLIRATGLKLKEYTPGEGSQPLSESQELWAGRVDSLIQSDVPLVGHAGKYVKSLLSAYLKPKPIMKHNVNHMGQIDEATGFNWQNRMIETYIPLGIALAIAALLAMMWAAREKEKEGGGSGGGGGGGGGHH